MKLLCAALGVLCATLCLNGCATYRRHGLDPEQAQVVKERLAQARPVITPDLAQRILALDPEHVTGREVHEVLSRAPAPRIINIHGGIFPVHTRMIRFSEFLNGMGFPLLSITNPGDGTYTFSCYESSAKVTGMIAYYYEEEGLRPIVVGHSQGGMQTIKILRHLAGLSGSEVAVWNPYTWRKESRTEINDPLTGEMRPVVGLQLPFAVSLCSGGLARILPNQWGMMFTLRSVPDSVEDFTGFYKHVDSLGGDFLGYGSINNYHAAGTAKVHNRRLPWWYTHGSIPDTRHLLKSQAIMDWINAYHPSDASFEVLSLDQKFDADSHNILWAAEVWYGIKKHWVLELQRKIRARPETHHGG